MSLYLILYREMSKEKLGERERGREGKRKKDRDRRGSGSDGKKSEIGKTI